MISVSVLQIMQVFVNNDNRLINLQFERQLALLAFVTKLFCRHLFHVGPEISVLACRIIV
jgi:hypothetical protein